MVGVAPLVTHAHKLHPDTLGVLKTLPKENLLLETDVPYLNLGTASSGVVTPFHVHIMYRWLVPLRGGDIDGWYRRCGKNFPAG